MLNGRNCLIIFCKEPESGRVKTRLAAHLGEEKSLRLYKAFLKDTLDLARALNPEGKILAYDAHSTNPDYLQAIGEGFIFYRQRGRDLGERMDNAFRYARASGFSRIVIIGSDSPTLPSSFLKEAFNRLRIYDVVIGPSHDGGYYLIGTKGHIPGLFQGVEWSSAYAFKSTMENTENLGRNAYSLKPWYDIDTPENLRFLENSLATGNIKSAVFTRKTLGLSAEARRAKGGLKGTTPVKAWGSIKPAYFAGGLLFYQMSSFVSKIDCCYRNPLTFRLRQGFGGQVILSPKGERKL